MSGLESFTIAPDMPPLGIAASHVLGLSKAEQTDARLLTLIAQKEPVFLARLLGFASRAGERGRQAVNVAEAIRLLGAPAVYLAMHELAQSPGLVDPDERFRAVRQLLLRETVSITVTLNRIATLVHLDPLGLATLYRAALFEVLALWVVMRAGLAHSQALLELLYETALRAAPIPRRHRLIADCMPVATQLAQAWCADPGVVHVVATHGRRLELLLQLAEHPERAPRGLCARMTDGPAAPVEVCVLNITHELIEARLEGVSFESQCMGHLPGAFSSLCLSGRPHELVFIQ